MLSAWAGVLRAAVVDVCTFLRDNRTMVRTCNRGHAGYKFCADDASTRHES